MVTLCRPKEDFLKEKAHMTIGIDEPVFENLLFRHNEIYAFSNEKMPVRSYVNLNEDYTDMVCVFYSRNNISELVRFLPEEFNKKFEHVSYTYW